MIKLTNSQVLYIANELKSRGLSKGFRAEILDHICCQVEEKLTSGQTFKKAYQDSLSAYGDKGFEELKKTSPILIKKRKIMLLQLSTVFTAATFTFFTFNFIKLDPPNSHPIGHNIEITSAFGLRQDPFKKVEKHHTGVDFRSETGTPVKATGDGLVIEASSNSRFGNKVIIKHDNKYQTLYAHMHELKVIEGQKVKKGEIIGTVGSTGASTAPHLHYEVIKNGKSVDPENYLDPINHSDK